MKLNVRVIATPALAAGFRLAGLPTDEIANPDQTGAAIAARSAEPGLGILLVEQCLLDAVPDAVRRDAERKAIPVLVPVPSPSRDEAPVDGDSVILEMLRRAIGYRVQLR